MEYFTSLKFENQYKLVSYKTNDTNINKKDYVVVNTNMGLELAKVMLEPKEDRKPKEGEEVKEILRKATEEDLDLFLANKEKAQQAMTICKQLVQDLKLEMNLQTADYNLDCSKLSFTYLADDRVDFRELLKQLSARFRCRIELRQIGVRDRARLVGGVGICGRSLCCGKSLTDFDVISIHMAKNQFLALNIQKLSGQCGKLKCCLKYENDIYSDIRKELPKIGSKLIFEDNQYTLSAINVLTRTCKLENPENVLFVELDAVFAKAKFLGRKKEEHETSKELQKR